MRSALQVLSSFRRIADSHRVDEMLAVATSAVREAENGEAFLRSIARETGIRARLIAGTEEAALIHLVAIHGTGGTDTSVVVDIGGGSVEISRGAAAADVAYSLKLGADGVYRRTDPAPGEPRFRVQEHLREDAQRRTLLARDVAGVSLRPEQRKSAS